VNTSWRWINYSYGEKQISAWASNPYILYDSRKDYLFSYVADLRNLLEVQEIAFDNRRYCIIRNPWNTQGTAWSTCSGNDEHHELIKLLWESLEL
jgi:hypothetical protein